MTSLPTEGFLLGIPNTPAAITISPDKMARQGIIRVCFLTAVNLDFGNMILLLLHNLGLVAVFVILMETD